MSTLTTFSIGSLVAVTNPTVENARLKNKLALVLSRPEEVEGRAVYAVRIASGDTSHGNRVVLVFEDEISAAPVSDRYTDENLRGEIIAKRTDSGVNIFAVEVGETGEVVVKTRTKA